MAQPCGFWRHLAWQRMAHDPEVAGSNPAPATRKALETGPFCLFHLPAAAVLQAFLQAARARRCEFWSRESGHGFEPSTAHP